MENKLISENVLKSLEWDKLKNIFLSNAQTEIGKKYISESEVLPPDKIRYRLKCISEIKNSILENYSFHFGGIRNIKEYCHRASKKSVLDFEEIFDIRQTLKAAIRIKKYTNKYNEEFKNIIQLSSLINDLPELDTLLSEALTDDCRLNTNKYPQIKKLQDSIDKIDGEILSKIKSLFFQSSKENIFQEHVHDKRNGRYVVLIKANMKGKIKGAVHDVSSSGSTLYFEPESISSLNTSLILKKIELENEIGEILRDLSMSISDYSNELIENIQLLSELDAINAAATLSISMNANEFILSENGNFRLLHAGHPHLILNIDNVVYNDIELDNSKNAMIITGANTGGKTVLLKTAGLLSIMALHGLHIPASPDSELPCFENIFADIGDDQDISESLSTFSGQIVSINNMLKSANKNTLILIDEIMSGTNPVQGSALAESVLEALADKGSKIIATTHYQQLNTIPLNNPRFRNASVSFNLEDLKPTYNLHNDIPGASYTLEIAALYNTPSDILQNAKNKLSSSELTSDILVEKLHQMENKLHLEETTIQNLRIELKEEKEKYNKLNKELKKNIKKTEEIEGIEFLDEIRRLKEKVSEKTFQLQKANIKETGIIQKELTDIENNIDSKIKSLKSEKQIDGFFRFNEQKAEPGDIAYIKDLDKSGTIYEIDSKNSEVTILLGIMKARYKFNQILYRKKSANNSDIKKLKNKFSSKNNSTSPNKVPLTIQTSYNTCDLRGMRVDEALSKLDKDIDSFQYSSLESAVVIHGHGTVALKQAVRNQLHNLKSVYSFRPGEQAEGGDGVTIILLSD